MTGFIVDPDRTVRPGDLHELQRTDLERDHVVRRMADWRRRVDSLYVRIEAWLPQGFTADRSLRAPLTGLPMERLGLEPETLPELRVLKAGAGEIARLLPCGLWLAGGNGRVRMTRRTILVDLIDRAPPLAAPDWRLFASGIAGEPLTRDTSLPLLTAEDR